MSNNNVNDEVSKPSFKDLAEIEPENVLEAAKAYTHLGLSVVPCKGKKPIPKEWQNLRLASEDLPRHFDDGQNVGLLLGEPSNGLVNVDLDVEEALKLRDWFLKRTVSGGREGTPEAHLYYRAPGAKTKKWLDTDGKVLLEMRSDGCHTLVASSVHPNGERYRWEPINVSEPIETTADELTKDCTKLATATVIARHLPPIGGRHEYAKAIVGYLLRRLDEETVLEIVLAAWHAGDGDSDEAVRDLEGIVDDTGRRLTEGENAFGGPTLEETAPGLPKLLNKWWGWKDYRRKDYGAGQSSKKDVPTQDELRDRWTGRDPGHNYGLGEWKRYEEGIFRPVHIDVVKRKIMEVLETAKGEGVRPTSGLLASVSELARVKLAIPDDEWDADPDILVCPNGTFHIPTGEVWPHSPEHHATSGVSYEYDAGATAPIWSRFLGDFVDVETAFFLQEFSGYALTTDVSHEIALWLCGPPGGGRSTFIAGLEAMLGERAGTLGLGEIERSRFALADVPGKTLLTATEQPAGFMKVSYVLNALISGDKLKVEKKFKDAFDVYSKAKILWAMNDVPRIPSANDGLFRRVKVVEIEPIPEEERDPEIKEAIKEEGAGILNWALKGLNRLRKRGHFEIPEAVQAATEEFKQTNDVPSTFVQEVCKVSDNEDSKEQASKLYKAYSHWCKISGHKPLSMTKMAKEWERLGFKKTYLQGRTYYRGVRVDPDWKKGANDDDYDFFLD